VFYILTRAHYNAAPAGCTEKDEVISQLKHALEKEKELRQATGLKLEKYIHTDFHEIKGQLSPQPSDCDTDIECIERRMASYMTPRTPERGESLRTEIPEKELEKSKISDVQDIDMRSYIWAARMQRENAIDLTCISVL
jgi:hypothetical protein